MSDSGTYLTGKEKTFAAPTQLPQTKEQRDEWLQKNKTWWEQNPMRYDWKRGIQPPEFSLEFYREIDHRSVSSMAPTIPYNKVPFDQLIDFESMADKSVLEIGVGNGGHAQLLATNCRTFTGIDLTSYGAKSTRIRMELLGIGNATIREMNAEQMDFPDKSFDFVWSWGVIHHSANTRQILSEIHRVLKEGGEFRAMVYHRGFWNYYVNGFLGGLFKGKLNKGIHRVVQENTDGAIARFYSPSEWRKELQQQGFKVDNVFVMGLKAELLPMPGGRIKSAILKMIPDRFAYWLTRHVRMGSFLVSFARKES